MTRGGIAATMATAVAMACGAAIVTFAGGAAAQGRAAQAQPASPSAATPSTPSGGAGGAPGSSAPPGTPPAATSPAAPPNPAVGPVVAPPPADPTDVSRAPTGPISPDGDAPPAGASGARGGDDTRGAGGAGGAGGAPVQPPSGQRAPAHAEPLVQAPPDPLAISPEIRARIGSDADYEAPPLPSDAPVTWSLTPLLERRHGDLRTRILPPLYVDQTLTLRDPATHAVVGEDHESLTTLLFYHRRSPAHDADVLFPVAWHLRDGQAHTTVLGPLVHRSAPGESDHWLAPLFFHGARPDGGYFHAPVLLTTSHWNARGAFTLVGPYFRDRSGTDVDIGVAPFFFHGDNGDLDARRTYTLIPPLLFYHRERELEQTTVTVAGPLYLRSTPQRDTAVLGPLFFRIVGKPETGGVKEQHTTLFPFFHYGTTPDESLFVIPGYLRRVTPKVDTLLTPLFSHVTTRAGATSLTLAGPVLPLYYSYSDRDIGLSTWAIAPLYYHSDSPSGRAFLTPLFGRFESYGVSRTWWTLPTLVVSTDQHGWDVNLHPILYTGRSDDATHVVVAPVFWDFANPRGRTTVGFPIFWRFSDHATDSVTQVAANTLYMQKRVPGGLDWQFHVLPLFSYGESPTGHWWNVLFGLAGYERDGAIAKVKALWVPIQVSGPGAPTQTAWGR